MYEKETLATEIFRELRASCKRWFIAFLVMTGLELATVGGFLWYVSLPVDETETTQTVDGISDSNVSQTIGGNLTYGENNTNNKAQETSNEETEEALT